MSYLTIKINLEKYCPQCYAILVIDKMDRGVPAKGGIRILPSLTEEEVQELAHEMSVKSLLAGLPFGGAKGGIVLADLERIPQAMYGFGRELAKLDFVPGKWSAGPDLNANCDAIDAFVAGVSSVIGWRKARLAATGKTSGAQHELGSTAYGILVGMDCFVQEMKLPIDTKKAGFLVEGIGQVGSNAVRALMDRGCKILGISDSTGALYCEQGLANYSILKLFDQKGHIREAKGEFADARYFADPRELQGMKADVLLLASPGKSMTVESAKKLQAGLVIEGANCAYADEAAEQAVFEKGIYSIPGVLINSGGIIGSYEEWHLEMENMMYLKEREMWERVKNSIAPRITRSMQEFCVRLKEDKGAEPHQVVREMYTRLEEQEHERSSRLRISTKNSNYQLEQILQKYYSQKY